MLDRDRLDGELQEKLDEEVRVVLRANRGRYQPRHETMDLLASWFERHGELRHRLDKLDAVSGVMPLWAVAYLVAIEVAESAEMDRKIHWTDEDVARRLEEAFWEGFRTYPETEGLELPAWENSKTKRFIDSLASEADGE